jgi:hypothetical protein
MKRLLLAPAQLEPGDHNPMPTEPAMVSQKITFHV